jgi:ribosomal protein S7
MEQNKSKSIINIKKNLLNHLMTCGKKTKCYNNFMNAIKLLQKTVKKSSTKIILLSIINSLFIIQAKKLIKRKGKQNFLQELPFIFSKNQRISFSIKYILLTLKKKKVKTLSELIYLEFLYNSQILEKKRKDTLHQEFILQKKYAKFRWFL